MLAAERRNLILEKVHENKKVIVSELSKEFDVSEETIRRDLDKLEEDGHVIKSYGGAVINEKGSIDLPFNVRWKSNTQGKQKIAELISQEIEDGDHIILDASTTAVFIAKNIKQKRHLTVVTNSIEILLELSDVSGWDIIATGGLLKAGSMSLLGKKAADILKICDGIYMPVRQDKVSVAKIEEFEEYILVSGHEKILEKVQRLKLPYPNSFGGQRDYLEQLLWGELGDYVRQLLKGK